jgi:hypothetical protein
MWSARAGRFYMLVSFRLPDPAPPITYNKGLCFLPVGERPVRSTVRPSSQNRAAFGMYEILLLHVGRHRDSFHGTCTRKLGFKTCDAFVPSICW